MLASAPAFSTQIFITNFTKNANLQTDYCSCYPTGLISDSNAYGTGAIGYNITPDGSGFNMEKINFATASGNTGYTTNIVQNIVNPVAVYLLLNIQGALAGKEPVVVTVKGTGGVTQTFDLLNGQDVRSLYLNDPVSTFNPLQSTRNVYSSGIPTPGQLGQGVYVLDEVRLTLSAAFVGQQLLSISLDEILGVGGLGVNGLPLLSAITVDGTIGTGPSGGPGPGTPEPGSIAMMLGGASLLAIGRKWFAN
jgi:hypothetical protein